LAAAPHDDERWHPLAAVYRRDVLPTAESLLNSGQRSLVALLEATEAKRVPLDALREVDPQLHSLASCNTMSEYEAVLRAVNRRP
jgi:molybdopterin-guanine dinucleotide biosynthesis protein A